MLNICIIQLEINGQHMSMPQGSRSNLDKYIMLVLLRTLKSVDKITINNEKILWRQLNNKNSLAICKINTQYSIEIGAYHSALSPNLLY